MLTALRMTMLPGPSFFKNLFTLVERHHSRNISFLQKRLFGFVPLQFSFRINTFKSPDQEYMQQL